MAKYRIVIDRDCCGGDRLCTEVAPATFEMDEMGRAFVADANGDPPEDILLAARKCPLQGISLFDAKTGEKVYPFR